MCVTANYVAGLAAIHVDQYGVARINLYAEQINADGEMERVLSDRLVMPCEGHARNRRSDADRSDDVTLP